MLKNSKLLLLAMLLLPWLTVPLLGRRSFKKYLPAAIFMATFTKGLDMFGVNKKWWRFYKGITHLNSMNFFNLGPYLITSLWILKLTYGKFLFYLISNAILHILFNLFGLTFLKRYKVGSLVKLTKLQFYLINFMRALVLYCFQFITDLSQFKKMP